MLHNAPIRDHTGFKLPPIPQSFSITHWPNKGCFSNKKDQQRNTESQFGATAIPYSPWHCVFVSGKLSTSIMDVIGSWKIARVESKKKTFPLDLMCLLVNGKNGKMERLKDDRCASWGVVIVTHVVSCIGSAVSSDDSWFHSEKRHTAEGERKRSDLHHWIFMILVRRDFSPHFFVVFRGG